MGNNQGSHTHEHAHEGHEHHNHSHDHEEHTGGCCGGIPTEKVETETFEEAVSKTIPSAGAKLPVSLLQPNGQLLRLPPPPHMNEKFIARISEVFSPDSPGFIYVAAQTVFENGLPEPVRFLGMLHGLAYIGHRVVVHNAAEAELERVVADADVVIVDLSFKDNLPNDFKQKVLQVAPNCDFFVSDAHTLALNEWE